MEVVTISPRDLDALRSGGRDVELIDVRTPVEYGEVHIPFARNVPLSDFDAATVARLLAAGVTNVVNVAGGTLAWAESGLPVVRGQRALALERQVRIAAGLLVLIGAILAWLVHPAFNALSAFVGAGLVFAGVTDTCGMGLLLSRMPWNRVAAAATACDSGAAPRARLGKLIND
jgi:rhodanese-related sulfurtransferase